MPKARDLSAGPDRRLRCDSRIAVPGRGVCGRRVPWRNDNVWPLPPLAPGHEETDLRLSELSDEVVVDVLASVLLFLQPVCHPAAARPRLVRLGVAVLSFHLGWRTYTGSISVRFGVLSPRYLFFAGLSDAQKARPQSPASSTPHGLQGSRQAPILLRQPRKAHQCRRVPAAVH